MYSETDVTTIVDPQGVAALTANHLIALDKCRGVRSIGVGEIARRTISKAVLFVIKSDVLEAAGSLQICAEYETGLKLPYIQCVASFMMQRLRLSCLLMLATHSNPSTVKLLS